ncbi:MAG: DUF835 domain-containing protein [Methanobacteriota archaeon]
MPDAQHICPGVSIIVEPEPNRIMKLFSELVTGGCKGLYMTRRCPSEVAKRPERGSVKYVWLPRKDSHTRGEEAFALGSTIERFLDESEGGVVAVDCVDCLNSASGGKTFAEMLGAVSRKALERGSYVLIQTSGMALSEEELEKHAGATGFPILARDGTG